MTPDELRRWGHATVDWVASYLERLPDLPVTPDVAPGDVRALLPPAAPQWGEPFDAVLADLDRVVVPALTHWQAPGFFGYFPANSSGPGILGDLVAAGLGVQGMLWSTSPACTEVEAHVLDWLADLLGLPAALRSTSTGGGVIQDSASSAVLCALVAARERATAGRSNRRGADGSLVAYASSQAHSSVEKAVRVAGIGSDNLRLVEVDHTHAMRPDALDRAIRADLAAGRRPFFTCATVGTTSSTAIDPVRAVGEVCHRHGLWLHVDAAYAGVAALCPELRWIHDGLELADSYCTNPHKWLLTNFDCTAFYVADRAALTGALGIQPEYLRNPASSSGAVVDYRDWQVPLGRRFRALKLWFVLRHYGAEGLRAHLRGHLALAAELAARVDADPRVELAAPAPLGLVCLRHTAGDDATQQLLDDLNATRRVLCTHTRLDDRLVLRVAIGGTATTREHVDGLWHLIDGLARPV
ncbi:MAG: aspartate aminotransferase family protein [Acidimicrobiales bacterium]|nr:aspartate aminotransferase family protein [Acidimicrobiales bacterium]